MSDEGNLLVKPAALERLEGAGIFVTSVALFSMVDGIWWQFAVLLLAPDLSMLAYLKNVRVGAAAYNAVHSLIGPFALLAYGFLTREMSILPYGLIWTAHIGIDRALGYGLKYPTTFQDTHLQRL